MIYNKHRTLNYKGAIQQIVFDRAQNKFHGRTLQSYYDVIFLY